MQHFCTATYLGFIFALTASASAQLTATTLAQKVDTRYNHLQSLQARYTERYQGLGMDRSETGTLTLRKPGKMRWAYDASPSAAAPVGKLFVLNGKFAISYTPGDSQAERIPAKQLDDLHSPLRFLLGHTELAKELDGLTLTLAAPDSYTLSGTPKGMADRIHAIALTVDATGTIHAMRIEDTDGTTTSFAFTNMRENIPTTENDFTFTPPAGVTVVDGAAPI